MDVLNLKLTSYAFCIAEEGKLMVIRNCDTGLKSDGIAVWLS
jgi:hypothetical protein